MKSVADKNVVCKLLEWEDLPNPKFPVVFYSVAGEDLRDSDSPSWYNPDEVSQVARVVKSILKSPKLAVSAKSIAVISPFYKQNVKIRERMRGDGNGDVFVGSVEECQGKEFMVVIISTVRASRLWENRYDRPFSMGFMNDERMMNTAFTRAKALLVVCGDPFVLTEDKHWNQFIQWTVQNKSYKGDYFDSNYIEKRQLREKKMTEALQKSGLGAAVSAGAQHHHASPDTSQSLEGDADGFESESELDFDGETDESSHFEDDAQPQQVSFTPNQNSSMASSSSSEHSLSSNGLNSYSQSLAHSPSTSAAASLIQAFQLHQQKNYANESAPAPMKMNPTGPQGGSEFPHMRPLCLWEQECLVSSGLLPPLPYVVVDRSNFVDIEVASFNSIPAVYVKNQLCIHSHILFTWADLF